ncbi:hypothetical protein [Candidatus Lariskella endosymbiont of Epinotia ramella]|uniref:hypothetical protein n=1 Tax=Candidatus Lariskella endosymbiont of Epinotia ramella TaxID=3066224 RepID=UPI0030D4066C
MLSLIKSRILINLYGYARGLMSAALTALEYQLKPCNILDLLHNLFKAQSYRYQQVN